MRPKNINKKIKKNEIIIKTINNEIKELEKKSNNIKIIDLKFSDLILPYIQTNFMGGVCNLLYNAIAKKYINHIPFIYYNNVTDLFSDYYDLKSYEFIKEHFDIFMAGVAFSVPFTFILAGYNIHKAWTNYWKKINEKTRISTKIKALKEKEKLEEEIMKDQLKIQLKSKQNKKQIANLMKNKKHFDLAEKCNYLEQEQYNEHRNELIKQHSNTI